MIKALQVMENFETLAGVTEALNASKIQLGYLGGRILYPSMSKPGYRLQVFFEADGITEKTWLPDNTRLVTIPDSVKRTLGIA